ncbi:MAG: tRNA pseudouridine(55) synthase TruB [Alphaproteobacteria bacterium]|nr:tRNA pseudouridine(55) synthase TruB [Alphaproteobacteria bacterium]
MTRKRKGNPINGWLVLDKPLGLSSMQAVSRARRAINAAKAGHSGTLDPLATGVLPIAFGDATKTISYVMDAEKEYRFEITFGEERNTDDAEGEVVETSQIRPIRKDIESIIPDFLGKIEQIPPKYSAIKVDGKRSYALARDGKEDEFELDSRIITVHSLDLENVSFAKGSAEGVEKVTFLVECSKGTYVRSLARDIAKKLGTCGYVSMLRRTKCGVFSEKDLISLEKINDLGHSAVASEYFCPIETVLDDILALQISEENARDLSFGRAISFEDEMVKPENEIPLEKGSIVCAMSDGRMIALCRVDGDMITPIKVMSSAQEYLNNNSVT